MKSGLTLFGYWRSSAVYRVRIALNLKGLEYRNLPVHLIENGGEQHKPEFRALNPQELIPVLQDGQRVIRQSLAIIEYLEESFAGPRLLPVDPRDRAHVRAIALAIACDIHPLNNLRVLQYLDRDLGVEPAGRDRWVQHWLSKGLSAIEALLSDDDVVGAYCHGDMPGLADAFLIPQIYNAQRFSVDMTPFPQLQKIYANCLVLPAFERAKPENQPDAPKP
ncbi:maleylacetoacetate isomerase [Pseudolysobacter antarcticus]|uniref:Maleylacetoacetate isomerase n=1 Tax=Pseudolysobacter antarcticus TaxID=2511995 RepID=A0A411HN14_9GAMM|nr:maleylacetoacetate isomerase [Pseudolysobacter antarcticus]QBB71860.1 maleylacetoacetate isomerase [Pseudolysobacter antarcticus]